MNCKPEVTESSLSVLGGTIIHAYRMGVHVKGLSDLGLKGFHWNRDRQHYGHKYETGGITPFSRYVMGGQQDVILMLIRRCSWGRRRLKALRFVSPVTLNLILTPSW